MSVRVRFAPSPTGNLHIGGARTALYNYLFAKAQNGTFILRIEDTDQERSTLEYEQAVLDHLKWLGLSWDEGPDKPGKCGPYRQSERKEIYQKYAQQLIDQDKAYYCFCTDEELDAKKEKAKAENLDPRYDGTCAGISKTEALKRLAAGEKATIRFRAPEKNYKFTDHVRKDVEFPAGMVGDFVIMRSNGLPVYNYCCVIDDWQMDITHVIRAEDHLANTLRQLMLYEAFDAKAPEFAHVSLLVGKDRQKLSKRHGATSVGNYQDESYLPEALNNYLCMLGWSHPEEKDIFTLKEIAPLFDLGRFTKSAAVFDFDKFRWVNEQYLRAMEPAQVAEEVSKRLAEDSFFNKQSNQWKEECAELFMEKMQCFNDIAPLVADLFNDKVEKSDDLQEILGWETTPQIKEYLYEKISQYSGEYIAADDFNEWSNYIKKELKIKGKPLFMGMRGVLTGMAHGSDLKKVVALTPREILVKRMEQL